jgi:hypothetical protein
VSFHYRRESSTEGILHRDNGLGPGIALAELLRHREMPISTTLEILAYCADALNDAQKNGSIHGEVNLNNICIDEEGAVVVNGFGRPRSFCHAPEGAPGPATDVYGLGVALLALLSGKEDFSPPIGSEEHDTVVVEQMIALDWQELQSQPWLNKIQEFLISMLSQAPEERPLPLDVANVLFGILPLTSGPSLSETARQCQSLFAFAETEDTENLHTPVAIEAPSVQPAALLPDSSQGAETGLWPRDKIQQILMQEEFQEKAERKTWAPDPSPEIRIEPTMDTASHPPRQKSRPPPPPAPPPPSLPPIAGFSTDEDTGAMPRAVQADPGPKKGHKAITAGRQPIPQRQPDQQDITSDSQKPWLKIAIAGGLALVLLCGLGSGLLGIYAWKSADSQLPGAVDVPSQQAEEAAAGKNPVPEPEVEPEMPEEIEEPEEIEVIKTRKPKPAKKSKPVKKSVGAARRSAPSTRTKRSGQPATNPAPQAQQGFSIRFMMPRMEGKIICGDGQSIEFVESVTMKFTDQQACRIQTDEARGAYIARAKATVRCSTLGEEISCN